ncbi:lipid A biosynthesis lauroyl acyltransferase [Lysobacter helvus]|uniref:Lipid A biosynthesis lauroyl acyltransferase n=2 Tax=Lysobacteraceae TaxID=32033 RepID=A0ABM7Q424_9GAMM|nr:MULTISPECIES: lauroyl acyltransferase [Lysobacter]BCT92041.1 lipid A biosynthesis lauroyl acyltransferase [Lysobacter caseinilyticus]BCT95194.1 lipid A biosynthesis lauroyl acyltransferase [Lysobacter helvus]
MTDLAARFLHFLATTVARLPWPLLRGCADAFAALQARGQGRMGKVVRRNLELAYPDQLPGQREGLRARVLRTTARQLFETLRFWTRPHAKNLAAIRESHGVDLFDAAIASGKGVIVAAPHYGSWELLNQWLAARTPLAILYAPPESRIGEGFLRRVRAAHGDADRVTQVRAEGPAIRQLFKLLQGGGVIGILPDQQPKAGDGEFAPFFGIPALTMTLLTRLAQRTGAIVLLGYCERIAESDDGPLFALRFEPVPDAADGVAALNAAVERVARRDPAQYQWTYKRFSIPAPGSTLGNPYWPDCYPARAQRDALKRQAPP